MAEQSKDLILDDLLAKQKDLMARVPHNVKPEAAVKMQIALKIIDTLMRYLGSTGHKPWRPVPLTAITQQNLLKDLEEKVGLLRYAHSTTTGANENFESSREYIRQVVSGLGIIEESVEYLTAVFENHHEEHRLEELVDIYFFLLEQTAMSGFTLEQVKNEYYRKWNVNIKRYEDGSKGDYSWDKRSEGTL